MIVAPTLDELATHILERISPTSAIGRGPYILFLGEGCAAAAGAPSREDLARVALKAFKYGSEEVSPSTSGKEVFEQFAEHTSSLSGPQFARMLRSLYAKVPVPSFYQDLALLIREQYFPLVVTMNFDTLLEQALAAVGVRNTQYRVTTFGRVATPPPFAFDPSSPPLTHLVKLHGDLAQDIAHLSPDDIETALSASRMWIKQDLMGDIIMVAHELGNDPIIDRWLSHAPWRELWWVNEERPSDMPRVSSWTQQSPYEITGELGRPNLFFSQLALRLLRTPETTSEEHYGGGEVPTSALAHTLEIEILRNQTVLYNLEQDRSPTQEDAKVQAQIQYQKRRMSRLEDRFRSLPDVQPRVLDAVRAIAGRIRTAAEQPDWLAPVHEPAAYRLESIATYVDRQADAVAQELNSHQPNQLLISASLSATLAVADRLHTEYGDRVINADNIKRLAALVPTAAGRVVL